MQQYERWYNVQVSLHNSLIEKGSTFLEPLINNYDFCKGINIRSRQSRNYAVMYTLSAGKFLSRSRSVINISVYNRIEHEGHTICAECLHWSSLVFEIGTLVDKEKS